MADLRRGEAPWHEMNKLLIRLIVVLYKVDRRKVFLLGATITTLGLFLQITLVPFPLFTRLHSPLVRVSSTSKSLTTSLQLSLGQVRYWPLYQTASPVPFNTSAQALKEVQASPALSNSSVETLKKVHSVEGNATVSKRKRRKGRRRRRRKREDEEDELEVETPPPPPTPATPLQVCHLISLALLHLC